MLKQHSRAFAFLVLLTVFALLGRSSTHYAGWLSFLHFKSLPEAEAQPPPGVYTYHYDNSRSGINPNEMVLKPTSVNQTTFGLLFTDSVDGSVYAQPLYVPAVQIGSVSHNVVFVATENDTLYAFDADTQGPPLAQVSLLGPGETAITANSACINNIPVQVGITSTPVIDPATGTLYVVATSQLTNGAGTQYIARLHALSIANPDASSELPGFPVVIGGSVQGNGSGSSGGVLSFNPQGGQRAALLLAQNNPAGGKQIYVAFASGPNPFVVNGVCKTNFSYHGWIFEYDAASGQQLGVFNTTPNSTLGGIWASGNGPAEDSDGEIYVAVANGDYDPPIGDYGDTLLKLNPAAQGSTQLTVADSFTPSYQCFNNVEDEDFGNGGLTLLPPQPTSPTNLVVTQDKFGTIYLLDRDALGGGPPPVTCPGTVPTPTAPPECATFPMLPECFFDIQPNPMKVYSAPIFFNGNLYVNPNNQTTEVFTMADGAFSNSPSATIPANQYLVSSRGAGMSISASGQNNALLWLDDAHTTAFLYAFDPTNLSAPVYVSNQPAGSPSPGAAVKFAVPMVINGKVYIGTQNDSRGLWDANYSAGCADNLAWGSNIHG